MNISIKQWLLVSISSMLFSTLAFAQNYPSRPVRIIVGYAAGGAPDVAARKLGQKLSQILGQPFIIENRPGASGTTATSYVAQSPADGYTLLLGDTAQLVIVPHIVKGMRYDTLKDFTPISRFYLSGGILIVSGEKTTIKNLDDLMREAKANPGKLSYGSSGVGSNHHIFMEVFLNATGMDIVHVPYKGTGQSTQAILGGEIPLLLSSTPSMAPHIKTGKVNLLAVASNARIPDYPNAPSLSETIKDFDFSSDFGLLAPDGLPPEVLKKLSDAIRQATEMPDFVAGFKESGATISYSPSEEYGASISRKYKAYEQAIKRANIPVTTIQ
jgi:tripartite-type tricarboxylate transporter receptor subunit TctC